MHRREGEHVYLRYLVVEDAPALLDLVQRNRDQFEQVQPNNDESFYTLAEQQRIIGLWTQAKVEGRRYPFGIFLKDTDELIGDISLFEVNRWPMNKCYLGYCLDEKFHRRGYMTEALRLVLDFAFREAEFHRIEAGALPRNAGSIRVLQKAGFREEGLARKNVNINGKWEDHVMFAILAEDNRTSTTT